jgi:hypothetical protein
LSQARRGWRRGVGVDVTVAPRSGPAPPRSRAAPPLSGSSHPRHSAAAARRRRRGSPAPTASPPLLPPPPFLFPFGGAALERGQNPNVGWWRWTTASCPPPLAFETPAPPGQGEIPGLPRLGPPGWPWRRRLPFSMRPWTPRHGAGAKGSFPSPARLDSRAGAPNPSACVPLGDPAVPRPASGCGETGGAGPVWCAGWVGEDKGGLTRGVHLPVTKGEGKGGCVV